MLSRLSFAVGGSREVRSHRIVLQCRINARPSKCTSPALCASSPPSPLPGGHAAEVQGLRPCVHVRVPDSWAGARWLNFGVGSWLPRPDGLVGWQGTGPLVIFLCLLRLSLCLEDSAVFWY